MIDITGGKVNKSLSGEHIVMHGCEVEHLGVIAVGCSKLLQKRLVCIVIQCAVGKVS